VSSSHKKYSSSKAKANKLKREKERAAKEKQKQLELEYAKATVEEYENLITALKTIHIDHSDNIDWQAVNSIPEPFPDPSITPGPKEQQAIIRKENYTPGFFAKRFKSFDDANRKSMEQSIENAKKQDSETYNKWKNLNDLSASVLNGDADVMLQLVDDEKIFDELVEFGSGFEIGFLNAKTAEVEFSIKADDVIPTEAKSLTSTGKLSTKALSKSKRLDIMQDYVCSTILRIAGDLFAILPITSVYITAMDSFIDTTLGNSEEKDIISVIIDRENYNKLNLQQIDPSDSMQNFKCNMNFL
jgi:hypothetical protein